MPEEVSNTGGRSPAVIIILFIIGSAYLLWRLIHLLRISYRGEKSGVKKGLLIAVSAAFVAGSSLPFFGSFLPAGDAQRFFRAAGNIWLGVIFGLAEITVVLHLAETVAYVVKAVKKKPVRSLGKKAAGALLLITLIYTAVFMTVGIITARTACKTEYNITLSGKKAGVSNLKIALISDLHISVNSSEKHMRDTVDIINAEEPDLVLVAGDIMTSCFTDMTSPGVYSEILSGIKSKYGVYAVYGNHDVNVPLILGIPTSGNSAVSRPAELDEFMHDCNITVLQDENTEIGDTGIILYGRKDGENPGTGEARKEPAELMHGYDGEGYAFVLEHEPWDYKQLAESGADFILSGHTHNGQIWPADILNRYFYDNSYGLKSFDGAQTLVTSGVGFFGPPVRLFTKSETAIINITFE